MSRESYMVCPNCDTPGERYKAPRQVPGLGVMRRHKCPNCRRIFLSLQKVVTGKYAEIVLNRIEQQEEQDGGGDEPADDANGAQGTRTGGGQATP